MASRAQVHDRVGEALDVGRAVCNAKVVATHIRPDINALLTVWIAQRLRRHAGLSPAGVAFIPASTTNVDEGTFAVDVGYGKGIVKCGKGWSLKRSDIKGSACMALYRALPDDDREAVEALVQAISEADEEGDNIHTMLLKEEFHGIRKWDNLQLRRRVLATTMWSVYHSLYHVMQDAELLAFWSRIFDGLLVSAIKEKEAAHASAVAEYKWGGLLAVLPHNAPLQSSRAAYENGALLALFSSNLGNGRWVLGLARKPGEEARYIDLDKYKNELKQYVPDLFIHKAGWMAGWTVKAPLVCSEREFTQKRLALIRAIDEVMRKVIESRG
jgi:hypothetical protein